VLTRPLAAAAALLLLGACASAGSKGSAVNLPATQAPTTTTPPATTGPTTTTPPATSPPATTAPATAPTTTRPTTTVAAPATLHITQADNGRTLSVPLGGTVTVTLASGELWSQPVSSDSAVLRRTSGSVNASTGDATATFSAGARGAAKITSDHRCLPQPGAACAMYIALWSVSVTVT
jgi:hypothetical protein